MFQPCPGAAPCRRGQRPVAPTSRIPRHIDGNRRRKKTATKPPRHAEVKVTSGSNCSPQFPITKLLKNKDSTNGGAHRGDCGGKVAVVGKIQEIRGGLCPHREPNERQGSAVS